MDGDFWKSTVAVLAPPLQGSPAHVRKAEFDGDNRRHRQSREGDGDTLQRHPQDYGQRGQHSTIDGGNQDKFHEEPRRQP